MKAVHLCTAKLSRSGMVRAGSRRLNEGRASLHGEAVLWTGVDSVLPEASMKAVHLCTAKVRSDLV